MKKTISMDKQARKFINSCNRLSHYSDYNFKPVKKFWNMQKNSQKQLYTELRNRVKYFYLSSKDGKKTNVYIFSNYECYRYFKDNYKQYFKMKMDLKNAEMEINNLHYDSDGDEDDDKKYLQSLKNLKTTSEELAKCILKISRYPETLNILRKIYPDDIAQNICNYLY